jgi:hypothetical protein
MDDNLPIPVTAVPVPPGSGFDYSQLPAEAQAVAAMAAEKIRAHQQRTVAEIIDIGAELVAVKKALGHGHFGAWLQSEFGWTVRTAQNYMRAAETFGTKCETVSHLPPKMIYALSAPSAETLRGEVLAKLENGERPDLDGVREKLAVARRKKQKTPKKPPTKRERQSRAKQWADACAQAKSALEDLLDLQQRFESWRENLPENLESSALGQKLDAVCDLDIEGAISIIDEADGLDLPQGFGRD